MYLVLKGVIHGTSKNKRVGNVKGDSLDSDTARCTSCGKEVKFKGTAKK